MSRYAYWTILIGNEPTSFRAGEPAELKPTLVQLQRTHPEARMVWFERGRLWGSPAEAHAALLAERAATRRRPATWRPGGKHEDPRQKYKDAKKARWTRFKQAIRARAESRPPAPERPKRTTEEILADWKPPPQKSQSDQRPQTPRTTQTTPARQQPQTPQTGHTTRRTETTQTHKAPGSGAKGFRDARSGQPRRWDSKPGGSGFRRKPGAAGRPSGPRKPRKG